MKYLFLASLLLLGMSTFAQNFAQLRESLKSEYEYVSYLQHEIATVRTHDGKQGLIDSLGNQLVPAIYDYIHIGAKDWIEAGIISKGKMKRGSISKSGLLKIPIIYDYIYRPPESGLIIVSIDNKKGAIDSLNTIKIPIEYSSITYANEERYIVEKDMYCAIVNSAGKAITQYDYIRIGRYREGIAIAVLPDKSTTSLNTDGRRLFPPVSGYSIAECRNGTCKTIESKNNKYGLIDILGKFIIPCIYDEAEFANNLFKVKQKNKWGLLSLGNRDITPIVYDNIYAWENDLFQIVKEKNHGIINAMNEVIIPLKYSHIDIHNTHILTQNNFRKYGVFTMEGVNIIPEDYVFFSIWQNQAFAEKDGHPIILNLATGGIAETDADSFKYADHSLFEVWDKQIFIKNGKYGVISIEKKVLIPAEYDDLESIYISGEFIAKRDGKYGIINSAGIIKQPFEFDKIIILKEYAELVRKNKKPLYYSIGYRDYPLQFK